MDKAVFFNQSKPELIEVSLDNNQVIYVRVMSGKLRDWTEKERKKDHYQEKVVIATACDSEGNLLFTDADLDKLIELDYRVIDKLTFAALGINDITAAKVDEKKSN